jgi:hypothetical protein
MLWQRYVYRRGTEVEGLWDSMFEKRPIRLLYIGGRGFDTRAQAVLSRLVGHLELSGATVAKAEMLLVAFSGYQLSQKLHDLTALNAGALETSFSRIGSSHTIAVGSSAGGEDDISPSNALRLCTADVLSRVTDHTDIVLDVSSLPRVAYLSLLTALLERLVPTREPGSLGAQGVNLQVLVAEDPRLDGQIRAEDPSNDPVMIPGFSSALHAESMQEWPLVWFPMLGENRVSQLEKVMASAIPDLAEICPVLPHPSRDPRRGDRLLVEYKRPLFDSRQTPMGNIIYVHEGNPFEAYRQLLGAMERYRRSMSIVGGCRLVVTPLGSKLITIGAGLACFEMRPTRQDERYGVAIPYAGPTRYVAEPEAFEAANPELATLLLTGTAYQ